MQIHLPDWLRAAIENEMEGVSGRELSRVWESLSAGYREGAATPARVEPLFWKAYLAGRLPATFAAVSAALAQVPESERGLWSSALDLGSGPGTALWAARELAPLSALSAVERSAEGVEMGGRLAAAAGAELNYTQGPLESAPAGPADLVLLSYALSELPGPKRAAALERAWGLCRRALALIEPGTPAGFAAILRARESLCAQGAHIAAPCPHQGPCPLESHPEGRWCHFSQRLERGKLSRALKGGELGYEDEKFCYLVVTREPLPRPQARVLGRPRQEGLGMRLELCAASGFERPLAMKRDKPAYRRARKADWGDAWD